MKIVGLYGGRFGYVWNDLEELDKSLKAFTDDGPSKSALQWSWDDGKIRPQIDQSVEEKLEAKLEDELHTKFASSDPSDFVPEDENGFEYAESLEYHGSETDDEESEIESATDSDNE